MSETCKLCGSTGKREDMPFNPDCSACRRLLEITEAAEDEDADCFECGKLKPLCACVISKQGVRK